MDLLPPSLIIRLTTTITPIDTSEYQARVINHTITHENSAEDEEVWSPPDMVLPEPYPEMLQHQDLSALLLDYKMWDTLLQWTENIERVPSDLTDEETAEYMVIAKVVAKTSMHPSVKLVPVTVMLGTISSSILYPVSRETFTCYDCGRPLDVYMLSQRCDEEVIPGKGILPRGYCPMCMCRLGWKREWESLVEQAKRSEDKPPELYSYLDGQKDAFLQKWNSETRDWWAKQKESLSPLYLHWRQRRGLPMVTSKST